MLRIKGNSIYLTRGDTAVFTLTVYYPGSGKEEYVPQDGDVIYFTVRAEAKQKDETDYVIQKIFDGGSITILPSDTKDLDYGDYVYDVQITTAEGVVNTIITESAFILEDEVT